MITKTIEVELLTSNQIRTRPVHQWDSGQIIKITDATIPDGTAVQFGNRFMKVAYEVYMEGNQVTIPAAALQQSRDLAAYIVVVDEDSETTVYEISIPVIPKPKPEGYVAGDEAENIKVLINSKANASGWTPNMYLGTDADGNMVTKDAPEGGGSGTSVPTKLSDLESDAEHRTVTDEEKAAWDAKSDFSGSYNDLTEKPTIPTVPSNVSAFTNDAGYLTEHQDISGKEDTDNKVTSISADSTDQQYPSAKCVYESAIKLQSMADKKVLIMGDSISTDAYGSYKKWVTDLIEEGFFSADKVTNNSYHATGFVRTYNENDSVVYDTFLNRLKTLTDTDYDLIVTFGGINDYIGGIEWDTFTAAVDEYFSYLTETFVSARNVVLLPLRTYNIYKNTVGHYQQEYSAYIAKVAKSYALPVLDLTYGSGFYPFIDEFKTRWTLVPEGYSSADGVHPNAEYSKNFLAPLIKGFLLNPVSGVWQKETDLSDYYTKSEVEAYVADYVAAHGGVKVVAWDGASRTGEAYVLSNTFSSDKYYTNINCNTLGLGKESTDITIDENSVTLSCGTYYGGLMFPFDVEIGKTYQLDVNVPLGICTIVALYETAESGTGIGEKIDSYTNWGSAVDKSFTITPTTNQIGICFGVSDSQGVTFANISFSEVS